MMLLKAIVCAAVAAATISITAPVQARMFDPALNVSVPATVQQVRWHHRRWHCWRDWRGHRHCGWRSW